MHMPPADHGQDAAPPVAALVRSGEQLLAPVREGLRQRDCQAALAALQTARHALPSLGDRPLQEVLQLQLRYLAWEVDLACAAEAQWRQQTREALVDLQQPQYTPAGRLAQGRLLLQLSLAAHLAGLRHLPPQELNLLLAGLPQSELEASVLQDMLRWAGQVGDSALAELAGSLLAQQA